MRPRSIYQEVSYQEFYIPRIETDFEVSIPASSIYPALPQGRARGRGGGNRVGSADRKSDQVRSVTCSIPAATPSVRSLLFVSGADPPFRLHSQYHSAVSRNVALARQARAPAGSPSSPSPGATARGADALTRSGAPCLTTELRLQNYEIGTSRCGDGSICQTSLRGHAAVPKPVEEDFAPVQPRDTSTRHSARGLAAGTGRGAAGVAAPGASWGACAPKKHPEARPRDVSRRPALRALSPIRRGEVPDAMVRQQRRLGARASPREALEEPRPQLLRAKQSPRCRKTT